MSASSRAGNAASAFGARAADGAWRRSGFQQPVERTGGCADGSRRDGDITGSGIDAAMAQQGLNDASVHAAFQQVGGEAVAQQMRQ